MSAAGTVLIIDDHEIVATSLTYVLAREGFDAHTAQVTDLDTIRDTALDHTPGVALLDLDLGDGPDARPLDGVDLVPPLCAQGWTVLVVTGTPDLDRVAAAIAAGAASWVVKGADLDELVTATVELAEGRGGLSDDERREMLERNRASQRKQTRTAGKLERLTAREREVLDQLTAGASANDIAQDSYTSIRTVRAHIRSILAKLEVTSQGAATAIAREHPARSHPIPASLWRRLRGLTDKGSTSRPARPTRPQRGDGPAGSPTSYGMSGPAGRHDCFSG